MKKLILLCVAQVVIAATAYGAGGVMIVDSEKIFKSVAGYTEAISQVDSLSLALQAQVDAKFEKIEQAFEKYAAERSLLTASQRSDRETTILVQEKMATDFQKLHFAEDGTIMKRRVELIAPIQSRVFGAIEAYATQEGFDVVIDKSGNASIIYYSQGVDRTEQIIEKLK